MVINLKCYNKNMKYIVKIINNVFTYFISNLDLYNFTKKLKMSIIKILLGIKIIY